MQSEYFSCASSLSHSLSNYPPSSSATYLRFSFFRQAHRLTPDFPDTLYELLCTLQEGRRLNDQRCSFRLESEVRRRRCHSEPNASRPANRGGGPFRSYTWLYSGKVMKQTQLLHWFPYSNWLMFIELKQYETTHSMWEKNVFEVVLLERFHIFPPLTA